MPYKSEKQRAYLHINEPELAKKWDKKYGGKIEKDTLSRQKQQAQAMRGK